MDEVFLTLNAGSSSIKFSVFLNQEKLIEKIQGQVENIGPTARLIYKHIGEEKNIIEIGAANHKTALQEIFSRGISSLGGDNITGIGHRIAHGGIDFTKPVKLSKPIIEKLRLLESLAPLHQPHNLKGIEAAQEAFPDAFQIGCFDTAFHRNHDWVNDTFALPRRFYEKGIRRYGFHGLSYDFITSELAKTEPALAKSRVIIAHLGNGASMCGVKEGRSIASTMGFSPLDGLPMGTRCGQLDPGVLLYLMENENMMASEISDLLYKKSGLLGLSGMTNDMRALTSTDKPEAKQALSYYATRTRREIGAMAALLQGVDGLIFCGGIGENSAPMRKMIVNGLEFLGLELDETANLKNNREIGKGKTRILAIKTDEERIIARALREFYSPNS